MDAKIVEELCKEYSGPDYKIGRDILRSLVKETNKKCPDKYLIRRLKVRFRDFKFYHGDSYSAEETKKMSILRQT